MGVDLNLTSDLQGVEKRLQVGQERLGKCSPQKLG